MGRGDGSGRMVSPDDADDTGMPAIARGPGEQIGFARFDLRERLFADGGLDGAAVAVQLVQLFGHATGLYGIRGAETARTQIGASNPAAGIDARTNHEAQMKAGGRGIKARDIR